MPTPSWREQTPPQARMAFLRVLGPWASASLELRRQGLDKPSVDPRVSMSLHRLDPIQTRRAA